MKRGNVMKPDDCLCDEIDPSDRPCLMCEVAAERAEYLERARAAKYEELLYDIEIEFPNLRK